MPAPFLHIYTGNGKGKTSAALGVAVRCLGRGKSVLIGHFLKHEPAGEELFFSHVPQSRISFYRFGLKSFIFSPSSEDREAARVGVNILHSRITGKNTVNLLILDEINTALHMKLLTLDDILPLVSENGLEDVICTGRNAPEKLCERADVITEMRERVHYFNRGVCARKGIDL
ncbi:MAG: cob(I)yrinic acid a,c-diamide adenosyltransferase [Fibrobacterota bacterium]